MRPIPKIGVVVDTSGSMSSEELGRAASEIQGMLRTVQSELIFLSNDASSEAEVCRAKTMHEVLNGFVGGGGTDFRPSIELLERLPPQHKPDIVVFITDGCGPAPVTGPSFRLIWVLVGPDKQKPWKAATSDAYSLSRSQEVDYGHFIWVEEDKAVSDSER